MGCSGGATLKDLDAPANNLHCKVCYKQHLNASTPLGGSGTLVDLHVTSTLSTTLSLISELIV